MTRVADIWGRTVTWLRRSGALQPTALKVLAFAVGCLLVLAVLAAKIGNITFFSHRVAYAAQMADATGLQPADDVKIAGVTVGQVTGVTVQRAHAVVSFALDSDVHLRADTQVGTQWHNVLGQQFLYLYPGHSGPMLRAGATLPLSQNTPSADIGALLNSLGPLLGALHPQQANEVVTAFAQALQGDEAQINQLIGNASTVSQTVGAADTQVGQLVDNLNQVLGALSQRSGDLGQVIANLDTVAQSLSGRNDLLDQTVTNLGQVAGEVATLEADTHGSLSSAIANLEAVSADVESHQSALAQGLSSLGSGLAPYADISAYGQWFQVQLVYTCLADETGCSYYEPTNPPSGSGQLGSPPSSGAPTPANSGVAAASVPPGASVGDVLDMVAGQGNFVGSAS
ncbi:MAG TPA: MCE family protein [Acidimicrobiales bacterium]|nr:MCE family protein [Acidimicrobiales bacterium]